MSEWSAQALATRPKCGLTTTLETVRCQRPDRVDFWAIGTWWGGRVADAWTRVVVASLREIATEAEGRSGLHIREGSR